MTHSTKDVKTGRVPWSQRISLGQLSIWVGGTLLFLCIGWTRIASPDTYVPDVTTSSQSVLESKYKIAWPESELLGHSVDVAARKYGINRNVILAVINQETHFRPRTSKAGAIGYMQVRPEFWHKSNICPYNVYDTHINVIAGTCVLAYYRKRLGTLEDALIAYNVGPSAIQTYEQGVQYRDAVLRGSK